jgi:hypothetical protein
LLIDKTDDEEANEKVAIVSAQSKGSPNPCPPLTSVGLAVVPW